MIIYESQTTYKPVGEIDCFRLDQPELVSQYMEGAFDDRPMQEQFYVILLNRKNQPICRELCTIGTINATLVSSQEVFRLAITKGATGIILVHNHPSGDPTPSVADKKVTQSIYLAGKQLGITIHDHVVIGSNGQYYSFEERGLMDTYAS
jgi:DNA repair protein RadC